MNVINKFYIIFKLKVNLIQCFYTRRKCMIDKILEVKNLNKSYDKFSINNLNFKLNAGEIVGFIGTNGAGKSTTIKSILNIIDIDSGEILFMGNSIKSNEMNAKLEIGYVGENNKFYNDITLKSLYKFVKESYKDRWDNEYFENLINNIFKIDMNKKIKELSKGMIVKYMIAIALSHKPRLLILDEPTSGLDPIIREEVLNILLDMNKKNNTTIFMSSHITEDIESVCNRVIYIDNGSILLDVDVENALKKYKKIRIDELNNEQREIFKSFSVLSNNYYLFNVDDNLSNINSDLFEDLTLNQILVYLKNKNLGGN